MSTDATADRTQASAPLPAAVEAAVRQAHAVRLPAEPAARAAALSPALAAVLVRLRRCARDWIETACDVKGIAPDSPAAADEVAGGPLATARALQCWRRSLAAVARHRTPALPGRPQTRGGRTVVPALPRLPGDRLVFAGYRAEIEVDAAEPLQQLSRSCGGVAVVLGAGNVTSIAPTDLLSKLCRDGRPTLVKLHPLLDPLAPCLADVFAPLAAFGCGFVRGDAAVGAALVRDPRVTAIHLTGSRATFDDLRAAAARRAEPPLLTGELGNVTPVIVVPGRWTSGELAAQTENVAAMLVQNGGFNCVAAKLLITARAWPQRTEFLERLAARLREIPRRAAWHPGAARRFGRFRGMPPDDPEALPYTLVTDVSPTTCPLPFTEEAFGPLLWETPLAGDDVAGYLGRAVDLCNESVHGRLAAMLVAPRAVLRGERQAVDAAVDALHYGTVAVNVWAALAFATMATPWGEPPDGGLGHVHESLFLRAPLRTVLRGPVRPWPTPAWWPKHRRARETMLALLEHTLQPGPAHLARVLAVASRA
ncbi:MAG: aldehyde dehydrogenase family protein [Planctomycetes bacterium]|nr:aldehyde dehydrogenase family protein [Planctomycetota bacterium]